MLLNSSSILRNTILFFVFILTFCTKIEPKPESQKNTIITSYLAVNDFYPIEKSEFVPFYKDVEREVIAIDAEVFKDEYSAAEVIFAEESGIYEFTFISMSEIDGESTYRIKINNELISEFQNPETENDFELILHHLNEIKIEKGDSIQVLFSTHSNMKIPENDGFAYARGRWKEIRFVKKE